MLLDECRHESKPGDKEPSHQLSDAGVLLEVACAAVEVHEDVDLALDVCEEILSQGCVSLQSDTPLPFTSSGKDLEHVRMRGHVSTMSTSTESHATDTIPGRTHELRTRIVSIMDSILFRVQSGTRVSSLTLSQKQRAVGAIFWQQLECIRRSTVSVRGASILMGGFRIAAGIFGATMLPGRQLGLVPAHFLVASTFSLA